jgi:O-methyltransferase
MDIDPGSPWYDSTFIQRFQVADLAARDVTPELAWEDKEDLVRRDMFLLLAHWLRRREVRGAVAEVGVGDGMTAALLCSVFPDSDIYLMDTFSGYCPEDVELERERTGMRVGTYAGRAMSPSAVAARIGNQRRVRLLTGKFPDSAVAEVTTKQFCLVHLDVDLYGPTRAGLEFFARRMQAGGFIAVHDYNAWPGARRAVDEFLEARNWPAVPIADKSGSIIICVPEAG